MYADSQEGAIALPRDTVAALAEVFAVWAHHLNQYIVTYLLTYLLTYL